MLIDDQTSSCKETIIKSDYTDHTAQEYDFTSIIKNVAYGRGSSNKKKTFQNFPISFIIQRSHCYFIKC